MDPLSVECALEFGDCCFFCSILGDCFSTDTTGGMSESLSSKGLDLFTGELGGVSTVSWYFLVGLCSLVFQ